MEAADDRELTTYALPYADFPYSLYDYQTNGMHTGEQMIDNATELHAVFEIMIPLALKQERKLIIKDQHEQVIFHVEEGMLIFPERGLMEMMEANDIECLRW